LNIKQTERERYGKEIRARALTKRSSRKFSETHTHTQRERERESAKESRGVAPSLVFEGGGLLFFFLFFCFPQERDSVTRNF